VSSTLPHVGDPALFSAMCNALIILRDEDQNISLQAALAFVAIASLPGGCSQADVCDQLRLPPGYVSNQVSKLANGLGLVDVKEDRIDRRRCRLFLTVRGANVANRMRFAIKEAFHESV
jgi:DNA-binding MarR family transcriptional regulator